MGSSNLIAIFLTGLISGGLTCIAVQGGLLAATIAQREQKRIQNSEFRIQNNGNVLPILSFLIAKLLAYTLLGFFLGYLGSFFTISVTATIALDIAVAVFMIGTALAILRVHPIFRYFVIQPPRFVQRTIRKEAKSGDVFAPVLLGAFTVFIPCGTTQAMMALAVASGNPYLGAAILFAFVLGTSPIFFLLGYFATKLSGVFQMRFMRFAAVAIILLALFNLNNAASLSGRVPTFASLWHTTYCTFSFCDIPIVDASLAQSRPIISIEASGYHPDSFVVKTGTPVSIHLINTTGSGCQASFTIAKLGLQKVVPVGQSGDLAFTAPIIPQDIPFTCSQGNYPGVIHVVRG